MSGKETADVLPPWQPVFDEDSGLYYYWNEETDEVTWEKPTKESVAAQQALPPNWKKEKDPETGEVFYWNTKTDETQWDPPTAGGGGGGGGGGGSAPKAGAGGGASKRKPRMVIVAESYDAGGEPFELKTFPKSDASKRVITDALKGAGFMFSALSPAEMDTMVMAMSERRLTAGDVIIQQGDNGDNFYVVESGDFDIFVNDNKVASRGAGSSFGELALLYNCPRAATVKASTTALVWALDRLTFRHMIASSREDHVGAIITGLRKVPLLEPLTDEQLSKVADAVVVMDFKPGDTIINKGDHGDTFYMIQGGKVVCTGAGSGDKVMADVFLGEGDYFGERALLMSAPRAANVIAQEQCQCMVLDRKAFTELLGPLHELLDKNLGVRVVGSVPLLKNLSAIEKERAVSQFRTVSYEGKQNILTQGTSSSSFFVVKSGTVKVKSTPAGGGAETVNMLGPGGYFGENSLIRDEPASSTVTAIGRAECFVLDRGDFERELGPLNEIMARGAPPSAAAGGAAGGSAAGAGAGSSAGASGSSKAGGARPKIPFKELEEVAVLGAGTFGRVTLVRHTKTNTPYALKTLQKGKVVGYKQQTNVMNEKNVMAMVDHPFVLKLEATYKDAQNLYMLLELVQGGELFSLLANQETGRLTSSHSRFYAACVILALECLHSMNILYRDLKPENMLLDAEGYIKVVDMGFAKIVESGRTYTLCGTPEYLAPELVLGKGHHKGVDYWAVGVLIYEMLCGYSPFADLENNDQMTICRNIVKAKVLFPDFVRDSPAKDLIHGLLNKTVNSRLGCTKHGCGAIKSHRWFKGFRWDSCAQKNLEAPWYPPLKDPYDVSNFDPVDEEDEIIPYTDDGSGWDADF